MDSELRLPSDEAYRLLVSGNEEYLRTGQHSGNISPGRREDTSENGQHPYAVVVTCSDSRVIPEIIFSAGIGNLFTIRTAGNTVDKCTVGSIEYAVSHLGCTLVVIMGHTECGAVTSTIRDEHAGHVGAILSVIKHAIGHEKDVCLACEKNVEFSLESLRKHYPEPEGVRYVGAMYDIRTGKVSFFD